MFRVDKLLLVGKDHHRRTILAIVAPNLERQMLPMQLGPQPHASPSSASSSSISSLMMTLLACRIVPSPLPSFGIERVPSDNCARVPPDRMLSQIPLSYSASMTARPVHSTATSPVISHNAIAARRIIKTTNISSVAAHVVLLRISFDLQHAVPTFLDADAPTGLGQ